MTRGKRHLWPCSGCGIAVPTLREIQEHEAYKHGAAAPEPRKRGKRPRK